MIRVTVEIVPGGDSTRARVIGRAEITKVGVGDEISDYTAIVRRGDLAVPTLVRAHDRRRLSAWALLNRVLEQLKFSGVMGRS